MTTFAEAELDGWRRNARTYDELVLPATRQAFAPIQHSLGDIRGKSVLEMCCGTGHLAHSLAENGARVIAIDFALEMVELARRSYPSIEFVEADCEHTSFANSRFDAVVCCFGALHFERPDAVFSEVNRLLKPGGLFVFTLWRGPDEGGEFLGMVLDVYNKHADMSVPLPAGPPMFELTNVSRTKERLARLGFTNTEFRDFDVVWSAPNAEGVRQILQNGMVRTRMILELQSPQRREAVLRAIDARAQHHSGSGQFRMKNGVRLFRTEKP